PTQYRFEARPWEIQSVPTVCGMCPVGCNTSVDLREGKVKRVRSRNHHEIDEGWLCDKGRFAFTHLRSGDRIVDPIKRVRLRGFEPVSWDDAIDTAEELLRAAHGRVVVALSGSETIEQAYAIAKLVRLGTDSHEAVLPEEVSGSTASCESVPRRTSFAMAYACSIVSEPESATTTRPCAARSSSSAVSIASSHETGSKPRRRT